MSDGPAIGSARLDFSTWATDSGPELTRFACAVTGSSHDAADAVQDALVAIYVRWRRLTREGPAGRVRPAGHRRPADLLVAEDRPAGVVDPAARSGRPLQDRNRK
jgi:DNA-directed RNA polymerase specialized sigma24 family protein